MKVFINNEMIGDYDNFRLAAKAFISEVKKLVAECDLDMSILSEICSTCWIEPPAPQKAKTFDRVLAYAKGMCWLDKTGEWVGGD